MTTAPDTLTEPAPLTREHLREVLLTAMRAGQLMLESGANTARVEETIYRVGRALGAEALEIYVTPTGIIASGVAGGEHRTRIVRVTRTSIDLNRIASVIEVSRQAAAGQLDREAVGAALERVAALPRLYGTVVTTVAVALACAAFAGLFGGGWPELGATALAAGLAHIVRHLLLQTRLNRVLITLVIASLVAGLGVGAAWLLGARPELVILSAELMLVPGAMLVSAVSDLFRGDTIAGMARGVSALLTLTAIGAGLWATLLLTGVQAALAPAQPPPAMASAGLATLATAGFAVLFNVPRRALALCALIGGAANTARLALLGAGAPPEAAIFAGGLIVGALALALAYGVRLPTSIFSIPGFITMVPGSLAFNAVVSFASTDYPGGLANLIRALLLTTALAAGVGTLSALARVYRPSSDGTPPVR